MVKEMEENSPYPLNPAELGGSAGRVLLTGEPA